MHFTKHWCVLALFTATALAKPDDSEPCDLAVVGAGIGGAYAAWHMAESGKKVCVFEMSGRPGGRIHSLRQQGPQKDLVVEAGAYRFAHEEVCVPVHGCIYTPITKATVAALGLHTAVYDPDPKQWDHNMRKIVDANGNDAGYLTLVETLLERAIKNGAQVQYHTEVLGLGGNSSDVQLQVTGGKMVRAHAVLLNLPQSVLLRLLRKSEGPITKSFPSPLYVPMAFPIMKLYVHYEDAWWRNYLGLVAGPFANGNPGTDPPTTWKRQVPYQQPAPLNGQYHDGDVKCDLPDGKCRGYLQAVYNGGSAIDFYKPFHPFDGDAAVELSPSTTEHKELLSEIHKALVEFHKDALDKANATARVEQMMPDSGVISIWSQGVDGIHSGCHLNKPKNNSSSESKDSLPHAALQPFPGWPVFVANEAYGNLHCWAEGSLNMSAMVIQHLGAQLQHPLPDKEASGPPAPGDPFLFMDHRRFESKPADLVVAMDEVLV